MSSNKAQKLANKFGGGKVFTNIEKMAKSNAIDCVYIASPNSLHYKHAITFLEHKKHVICEKPIFSNKKELMEAFQVAKKHGVFLFEAIRNLYTPNFKKLQQELEKVGKIRSAFFHRVRYSSRYELYLKGNCSNVFSLESSGGALMAVGVYPVHLAVALFGEPIKVLYTPVKLSTGVDCSGTLILEYSNFICTMMCSTISTSFLPCEIHGEKGTISFEDSTKINNMRCVNHDKRQLSVVSSSDIEHDICYEIEYFLKMIKENNLKDYEKSQTQSLLVLEIIDKARKQNQITFTNELQ